ncbi:MAG: MaoC family dehydratase [Chloroflexi bacterium]|nr:MaoC family dehydratase [Chloroflexota bacterium]
MSLPELIKVVRQEKIDLYAEASKDFNPIHIDEDFAKKTPLGGTIAHGMLILAYISQMMTAAFGRDWLSGGKLDVRFKSPARPGDTITVSGEIQRVEKIEGRSLVRCAVDCHNQHGEPVITGEAMVKV